MTDRVLVTGISGFLAGHVALLLLRAGYRVRGSLRDPNRAEGVRATLEGAGADVSRLEFTTLDLMSDKGWSEAIQDCRYMQHIASPLPLRAPKDPMTIISPAVEGTTRAITAALAADVERIVLTSSMAAIAYGHAQRRSGRFEQTDWTNLEAPDLHPYVRAKTQAERRAWDLMIAANRKTDLVAINPGVILGPLLNADPGASIAPIIRLLKGGIPALPRLSLVIADVRDVAEAHVAAMTAPTAGGHRFPIGERTLWALDMVDILRQEFPDRAGQLPRLVLPDWLVRLYGLFDPDLRGNLGELGETKSLAAASATVLLGHTLTPADATIIATAQSLIARHLV